MSGGLKRLSVEHLRGSLKPFTLDFERAKRLTIIYGENGSGKSTICDAFDFIGNGKVGSLDGRGLGKTLGFWHAVGSFPSDVRVELESHSGTCSAVLEKGLVVASPADRRPSIEVLRRSQILGLVEAKPADRYEAIRRFVDVENVEAAENSLRALLRSIEADEKTSIVRIEQNRETISGYWESAGRPAPEMLAWAAQEVSCSNSATDKEIQFIRSLQRAMTSLRSAVSQRTAVKSRTVPSTEERDRTQQEFDAAASAVSASAPAAIEILQAAQPHFARHPDPQRCPLCESSENAAGLAARVAGQLAAISSLGRLREAESRRDRARDGLAALEQSIVASTEAVLREANELRTRLADPDWPEGVPKAASDLPGEADAIGQWVEVNVGLIDSWADAENARAARAQAGKNLAAAVAQLKKNTTLHSEIARILPHLGEALRIMESERKAFVDAKLADIASDVGVLYEKIHPREGLGKISLVLDPKKRASLDIAVDFRGSLIAPPQAYFSDSHLDTLGLCVFIALAARESADETVLVLDDVLASVDEPHVDRLIEVLYDQAQRFRHVVITTHYQAWREKYRWGWLKHGQCQWVELGPWSAASGICSSKASAAPLLELASLLQQVPPSPQLQCASAGVLLEAICNFLTESYECDVPRRKGGRLTLGDMLPKIPRKLRDALKVEVLQPDQNYSEVPLSTMISELQEMMQLRNIFGAHYNDLAQKLPAADATRFATLVHDLGSTLICADEGWPGSDKSGSYWSTKSETRRLHPLKKPA